ncbi:unnamed protein product [Urochloa decumbens]|uniref:Uncharacterized protein n=1 Tax=Urochloa decumbens TaxID=240449 RepID=A0ABC9H718_9POAL
MKFIRQGCKVPCSQYNLSRNIRTLAFKVAMFQGKWSPHIAAFLLGIIKEAELLLDENISGRYLDAIDTSDKIRREFEKNKLEKKCGNMYKKPKQKTNNSGSDISSLSKEGYFSSFPCNGTDYLSRKTIIATEYL